MKKKNNFYVLNWLNKVKMKKKKMLTILNYLVSVLK